jgi:hypothetical protein
VSVAAFLAELRSLDIEVWPDGEQLRCNAPAGSLNPALRNTLRERKSEIVKFLRSAEAAARQPHAIVPIQPRGARTPVFAVGGHNGDVFCYRALAQCLGEDQPFFGLRPPGLDGEAEPFRASRPRGALLQRHSVGSLVWCVHHCRLLCRRSYRVRGRTTSRPAGRTGAVCRTVRRSISHLVPADSDNSVIASRITRIVFTSTRVLWQQDH